MEAQIPGWTPIHDAYCLEHGITPSAKLLWQWLVSRSEVPEQEPDLAEFNAWVEKHRGKGYHRDTIKKAFKALIDCKAIEVLKPFTWRIWRIKVRPINLIVNPPRPLKKSHNCDSVRDSDASNPQSADEEVITTTTFSQNNQDEDFKQKLYLCHEAGIEYQFKEAGFLKTFSLEQIKKAIAYFLFKRNNVDYPEGWFRKCLEDNYAERYLESVEHNQHFGSGLFGFTRPVTSSLANGS